MAKLYAVVLLALVAIVPAQKAFDGYKVVSVTPSTEEQLEWLLEVREIYNLDFWTEPRGINKPFDILLPPYLPQLPREMNSKGIVAEIRIRDVQDLIDQQNPSSVKIPRNLDDLQTYKKSYKGYMVVQITPKSGEEIEWLLEMRETYYLDFWTEPRGVGKPFEVMFPPYLPHLKKQITEKGIHAEIMIRDVQDLIDSQASDSIKHTRNTVTSHISPYKKSYKGYMVVRITPKSEEEIEWLLKIRETYFLDFWTEPHGVGKPFEVMFPPYLPHLRKQIKEKGIHAEIMIRDVQDLIDSQEHDSIKQTRKIETDLITPYKKYFNGGIDAQEIESMKQPRDIVSLISPYKKSYKGYMVVEVTPKTQEELDWLVKIGEIYNLDFWTWPNGVGKPFDVLLPPYLPHLKKQMNKKGIHAEIKIRDVQQLIDIQASDSIKQPRGAQSFWTKPNEVHKPHDGRINSFWTKPSEVHKPHVGP